MSALAKILVLVVTMTPFVFLADCVYQEIALGRSLQHLCVSTEPESKLSDARSVVASIVSPVVRPFKRRARTRCIAARIAALTARLR